MLFPHLQKLKGSSQQFDEIIDLTIRFLEEWFSKNLSIGKPQRKFNAKLFSGRNELDIEISLAILELCVTEKILEPEYKFLCPETTDFIKSFQNLRDTPETLKCWQHDTEIEHPVGECLVEYMFGFTEEFLTNTKEQSV